MEKVVTVSVKLAMKYVLLLLLCTGITLAKGQTIFAENGRSDFTVIVPADRPRSVKEAADEFLTVFAKSTGVRLPVAHDGNVKKPFISIGDTKQAREAGITYDDIREEGFRILLRNGNLFIIGRDTPDGHTTPEGGVSNGTANGVYTFLEDYLDARWLMPGESGRTVAEKDTLVLSDIDRSEAPVFISRKLPYLDASHTMVNSSTEVLKWQQRQKLGYSINLWHSHNWEQTVPASLYEQHPEWFAMKDGKRPPPGFRYKLETTDTGLVRFFADRAIDGLKANTHPRTFSLSPSDSRGWSESPASQSLYDPPPPGEKYPGMSSLVLKFYHDVSAIVRQRYPEGRLAGYLYDSYLYPPTKAAMKLPDNFIPVIAPSSITYGYRLYHEKNKRNWDYVMRSWSEVAPPIWVYYDIPNAFNLWRITADYDRLSGAVGIVTPPAAELLNFIFSGMVKYHIRGAYLFGTPTWSNTAIANYMMAKMMWDPTLDAYAVQRDWLNHAYGAEAGAEMEKFYRKLEAIYREYSQDKVISSRPNDAMFRDLYGTHYPEMEQLYLHAVSKDMSTDQKARLQLIGDNLTVLQWRLRNAGFLPERFQSPLTQKTAGINRLLQRKGDAFAHFPEALIGWRKQDISTLKHIPVAVRDVLPEGRSSEEIPLQDKHLVVLHAADSAQVGVYTRDVKHGTLFASCVIMTSEGEEVYTGLLDPEVPITFRAEKGNTYYLYFPARPGTSCEVDITGSLTDAQLSGKQVVVQRQDHPVHVYIPYQQQDAIIAASQAGRQTVRIVKNNRMEATGRLDPQD